MGIKLSYSAAERYLSSARSYFLHYLLRLRPVERSSALYFGSAVDDALNILLAKPLDRSDNALLRAKDTFDDSWAKSDGIDLSAPGAIKFSKADSNDAPAYKSQADSLQVDPTWFSMQVKGHMILDAYYEQIVPRIKEVIAVQEEISLTNELGDAFTGIIDLIVVWEDGRRILFDNKTSSVKYAQDAIEKSGQLATYYEAVKEKYNIDAVGYIVIPKQVRKKKIPFVPIEVMIGSIPEKLIQETFEKYEYVLDGIKNGEFSCSRNVDGGCCSKPWPCSYRRYCESKGTDMTGLAYVKDKK